MCEKIFQKGMKRRLFSVVLVLAMVFLFMPMNISASGQAGSATFEIAGEEPVTLTWDELIEGIDCIKYGYGKVTATAVEPQAFIECTSLTSITIPDGVTVIGDMSFINCSNLTSVTFSDSVTLIDGAAFDFCSKLTSLTIPKNVATIGECAFGGCTGLDSVTFMGTVGTNGDGICDSAFLGVGSIGGTDNPTLEFPNEWTGAKQDTTTGEFKGGYFKVSGGKTHIHNSNAYGYNNTQHWTKCTEDEDNNGTPVNHTWSEGVCSTCSYVCSHDGATQGTCSVCGKYLGGSSHSSSSSHSNSSGSSGSYFPTPSTPSTQSTPTETYSATVKGDDTVHIDASIKDGKAEVKEITSADIDKINTNSATGTETTTVTIDLSGAKQDVNEVTLTKKTVDTLAKATADTSNRVNNVEVKLSKVTVILDETAIESINNQAKGDKVSIKVEDTKISDLNASQQAALNAMDVVNSFEAYVESEGTKIHDFKGGNVTVSIAFVVPTGKKANHYFVYYVADDGTIEKFSTNVSDNKGTIDFTTSHFSDFVIIYNENEENDTPKQIKVTASTYNKKPVATKSSVPTKSQIDKNTLALNAGLKLSQTGKDINVSWGKVAKADGYYVYAAYCGNSVEKVKTINDVDTTSCKISKLDGKNIEPTKNFKVRVKAYKVIDGKKVNIGETITAHVAGCDSAKYSNPKSITLSSNKVTLKVGKTSIIEASVVLADTTKTSLSDLHTKEFRFASSDTKVATVSESGKITAKKAGTCTIYIYARNGCAKTVAVRVK